MLRQSCTLRSCTCEGTWGVYVCLYLACPALEEIGPTLGRHHLTRHHIYPKSHCQRLDLFSVTHPQRTVSGLPYDLTSASCLPSCLSPLRVVGYLCHVSVSHLVGLGGPEGAVRVGPQTGQARRVPHHIRARRLLWQGQEAPTDGILACFTAEDASTAVFPGPQGGGHVGGGDASGGVPATHTEDRGRGQGAAAALGGGGGGGARGA